MKETAQGKSGLVPRDKEKELQKKGLKSKHTHPKKEDSVKNEDPNGMTAKTLSEMKKNLKSVPKKSAATKHDKEAYS